MVAKLPLNDLPAGMTQVHPLPNGRKPPHRGGKAGSTVMQERTFGQRGRISALSLGGGGIGQVWGTTTRDEAVATVREAAASGITLIDVAASYGRGEAEQVIGEAFAGKLPPHVRICTKCHVRGVPDDKAMSHITQSLDASLARMKLDRVDIFFLHNMIIPDDTVGRYEGTPRHQFKSEIRPAFEKLVARGRIGAWGISGLGIPAAIEETLDENPPPAAIQIVTNVLDTLGRLKHYDGSARPRDLIVTANKRNVAVMGIHALAGGALADTVDRELSEDEPTMVNYRRAEFLRIMANRLGESAASLAHRYALSMAGLSTVILGVKDRKELRQAIEAEAKGPLNQQLIARIDTAANQRPGTAGQPP